MTETAQRRPDGCLSDLTIDRLLAGELAASPALATAEAHLAACPLCRARRSGIEAAPAHAPDPAWWQARRAAARRKRRTLVAGGGLALAAAAAFMFVVRPGTVENRAGTGITRVKGGELALDLLVRRTGGAEPVLPDLPLHPGDAIGFKVRTLQPGYLVVLGLDGAGKVSPYGQAHLSSAGERLLDDSVILDDALGGETVFALVCPTEADTRRSIEVARAALARAGSPAAVTRLDLPCLQAHASFKKEAAP